MIIAKINININPVSSIQLNRFYHIRNINNMLAQYKNKLGTYVWL